MPLVINSLGGGHAHRLCGQKQFQETMCVPAFGQRVPGLKMYYRFYKMFLLLTSLKKMPFLVILNNKLLKTCMWQSV